MPSELQIGLMEDGQPLREPTLCAVTGRDVRGKHAVTHYGPNGQFVYVLAQVDHLWPMAAPAYGFPVPEAQTKEDPNVFVLDTSLNEQIPVYGGESNQPLGTFLANSDNPPLPGSKLVKPRPPIMPTVTPDTSIKDGE